MKLTNLLANVFCLGISLISSAEASDTTTVEVSLPTFQLEIRSKELSLSEELASVDLQQATETHLMNFIERTNRDNVVWNGIESISLYAEKENMNSLRRRLGTQHSRKVQSTVVFQVEYSGYLTCSSDASPLPSTEQTEKIILESFIGQGKLDYLRLLRASDDVFLSSANYAKVWIPNEEVEPVPKIAGENKTFFIVSILASIVIALSIVLMVYYIFCYKRGSVEQRQQTLPQTQRKKSSRQSNQQKRSSNDDIRLAPTRSMSPPPEQTKKSKQSSKRQKSRQNHPQSRNHHHMNADSSMMSKDTIDINGSFDMIAWKNTCLDSKTPFETDLTMITNASPNKTIQVEVPREIGGRRKASSSSLSSSSSRLSHGMLNQHNQRYGKHSSSSHRSRSRR